MSEKYTFIILLSFYSFIHGNKLSSNKVVQIYILWRLRAANLFFKGKGNKQGLQLYDIIFAEM